MADRFPDGSQLPTAWPMADDAIGHRLVGKIAIVTGAGSVGPGWGNGRAIAVRFAREGARVIAVDRDLAALDDTLALAGEAAELGGEALSGTPVACLGNAPGLMSRRLQRFLAGQLDT